MTMAVPVQDFQIGQRVRPNNGTLSFVIAGVYARNERFEYSALGRAWYATHELTLAPERPPYVPSERRTVRRLVELCRCETDDELAARHAAERAAYDAQGDGA